jgi:hypothetical protein
MGSEEWNRMVSLVDSVRRITWDSPLVRAEYVARLRMVVDDLERKAMQERLPSPTVTP